MTDQKFNLPSSGDTELARLVLEQNLATQTEVEQAAETAGREARPLADVLVQSSVVTASQITRMQGRLEESRRGSEIPGYKIEQRLDAGSQATVFKARQLSLDRVVAIKVLPKKMSENSEYVQRFYREGKAAAKLNHPNIVQAFDVGEASGYHYFVMEFVKGHTLYDELAKNKVFSEAEGLDVIIQVGRALEHAHGQGLIHRDVKPKNIMITDEGTVKLADMGLARLASDVEVAQAEAGKAFGTPYYISPEQIRGELKIDFRADIYSLGATLYHLVTGRVPFEGPTPAAVMHKHLKDPLIPPDHINTALSAGLGEVVEVMMAKDPSRRYASTRDMLIDLEAIRRGEPPPQARRQISADLLTGLAAEQQEENADNETVEMAPQDASAVNYKLYLILVLAALAISAILNLVQLIAR